jgi:thiol-disulfide isomerase/thioredoxin
MNSRLLLASILLSGTLLGFLNYKLKPRLDEKQLDQMTQGLTASIQWQGQIAPDFDLVTTRGDTFRISDHVGKKMIVLNFFATWCGPCREEMPELDRYFDEHQSDPFLLIGIDSDEKPALVNSFLDELKLDFPVGIDSGPIQKQYGVSAFPTTVIIGADGRVAFYESGGIANPEVAFDNYLHIQRSLIEKGYGISPEKYREQARLHPSLPSRKSEKGAEIKISSAGSDNSDDEPKLDDRGKRIAGRMGCPCGCAQTVEKCVCNTSKNIKKALATEDFKNTPDDQIIRGLNNRFCGGPSGQM